MFEPGDQKIYRALEIHLASSRWVNRIYAAIALLVGFVGVGCLFVDEWLVGAILTVVGGGCVVLFLKPEISERLMVRRMRKRKAASRPGQLPPT